MSESTPFQDYAESYCRMVVSIWLIAGVVYSVCTGSVLSLPTLLLFFPGFFVACGIAWAGFNVSINLLSLVRTLIMHLEAKGRLRGWPGHVLIVAATVAALIRWTLPICLAVLYIRMLRGIFH